MDSILLGAPCGLYCGNCDFMGVQCSGCLQTHGKPFWTAQVKMETCPMYDCCVNEKHLEHCGLCSTFPCDSFNTLRDPSLSDEDFEKSLQNRKDLLSRRKEIGTEAWFAEFSKER